MAKRTANGFPAEYAALVADVLASPDDDTPRLVLADALMEKNDPRGELIAIQCARSEADDAVDRVEELLYEHADRWTDGLGPSSLRFVFHRGFVEEVRGPSDALVRNLRALAQQVPLRKVVLTSFERKHAAELVRLLVETSVRSLSLAGRASSEFVAAFADSSLPSTLEELDLADASEAVVQRTMPRLRRLRLKTWDYSDRPSGLDELRAPLEELRVEGNPDGTLRGLRGISIAEGLRRLSVSRCALGRLASVQCPNLESVDVDELVQVDENELAEFLSRPVPLRHLGARGALRRTMIGPLLRVAASLERLDLSECDPRMEGVRAMVETPLPKLRELTIRRARFGNESSLSGPILEVLCTAPWLRSLRALQLGLQQFGDDGASVIASTELPEIRVLGLQETGLGARGAKALADTSTMPRLRALDLSDNDLGEDGAMALANGSGLKAIAHLELHNMRLGVAAGRALRARFGRALEKSFD